MAAQAVYNTAYGYANYYNGATDYMINSQGYDRYATQNLVSNVVTMSRNAQEGVYQPPMTYNYSSTTRAADPYGADSVSSATVTYCQGIHTYTAATGWYWDYSNC